jgi:hypothetical protein
MIGNQVPIDITNGKAFFKELSFYEYKNICKMLMSDNVYDINHCFENIIDKNVVSSRPLNIIDKFKCLLTIRNTILGNEVTFLHDGKQINIDLSLILNKEQNNEPIVYDILTLSSPVNFYSTSYDKYIAECLIKIKDTDVTDLTLDEKIEIISETSLSITDIYSKLKETFQEREINIFAGIDINIYSQEYILKFLKNIFYEDLFQILNFEFVCMRNLDFKSADFKTYTYPEIKIFLNHLNKEKENEKNAITEG